MNRKLAPIVIALAILPAFPAAAHFPPGPNTNCDPAQADHDVVGAGSARATGVVVVHDGAIGPCDTVFLCPSGENFVTVDPSGDDFPDGTDPSGDDVVITCGDILVGNTLVPAGDGEYELGVGGAFLPASHHSVDGGYYVSGTLAPGGFGFGTDGDGDGAISSEEDCYEIHASASEGSYTTSCVEPGADDGWWIITRCGLGLYELSLELSCLTSAHVGTYGSGGSGGDGFTSTQQMTVGDAGVSGPVVPTYVADCLLENPNIGCFAEPPAPDDAEADPGTPDPAGSGSSQPCSTPPYVEVVGIWGHDSTHGNYIDNTARYSYYQLHHCSSEWNQQMSRFTHSSPSYATYVGHDQVHVGYNDYRIAWTCVSFLLDDGTSVGRCDWMYN